MLLSSVENMVNHLLATDEYSQRKLAQFSGKFVAVEFTGLTFTCYMKITPSGIELSKDAKQAADCRLRGSRLSILRYMNQGIANPAVNTALGVEIEGDLELARQLSAIFKRLDIDWEELISQATGDFPARHLFGAFSSLRAGFGKSIQAAKQNLGYVVSERSEQIVSAQEAEIFYEQVDKLQADLARLEKKVNLLVDGA